MNDHILFLDLESTGLSVYRDRIVEIGIIYRGNEKVIRLNPEMNIPEGASRVHGIRDNDVKDCQTFSDIAEQIYKLFSECKCVCGYNIKSYDLPLLQVELLKCNKDYLLPDFEILDVYELTQSLFKSLKLKDIYLTLSGKPLVKAHSSISDIRASKELLEIIQERFLKNNK
mgnify:CR=1 FL=1